MDLIDYYYNKDSSRATATPTPSNGNFKLYSIAYPMLAKPASKAGASSPTGASTNRFEVEDVSTSTKYVVTFTEGFYTVDGLAEVINEALKRVPFIDLTYMVLGQSQVIWMNNSSVAYNVIYPNLETKALIRGEYEGPLTEIIPANTVPFFTEVFYPDPSLGLNSLEFRIANGERISLPASGQYLDNVLFYLDSPPDLAMKGSNICSLIANYASIRITKELVCPRQALIRLAIENFNK